MCRAARSVHVCFTPDSKSRTIGIDIAGVLGQLQEHDRRATALAAAESAELQRLKELTQCTDLADKATAQAKLAAAAQLSATWAVQRDLTLGREWDLNDPKGTFKSTLSRNTDPVWATRDFAPVSSLQVSIRGIHCVVFNVYQNKCACAQVFDAELLEDPAIPIAKRADLIANLDEGVEEAKRRRANEAMSLCVDAVKSETMRRLADSAAAAEAACAAASRALMRRDNEVLLEKATEAAGRLRAATEAAEERQVAAVLSDPMLREDTRTSINVSCPLRFRPDHFRGLSAAQRDDIRRTQKLQASCMVCSTSITLIQPCSASVRL